MAVGQKGQHENQKEVNQKEENSLRKMQTSTGEWQWLQEEEYENSTTGIGPILTARCAS